MRPQGEARISLAEGMRAAGPGITRVLAERVGLPEDVARRTLDNMRKADQVAVVGEQRVQGVRRPVPVYDLADRHRAPASWLPLQCWCLGHALV